MLYRLGAMVFVLAASTVVGVSLGHATVAEMQIRARPPEDSTSPADHAFDRGVHWAKAHGILRSEDCPEPDQYFLSGCVAASSSDG